MFIKYNPKDKHIKVIPMVIRANVGGKAVPLAGDSVTLRPGTNELTEKEWEAIQPHIQEEIKQKIIIPFSVEVDKAGSVTKARTLKDVPVSVARKIIESCQNVADLKKWAKQELPDEIMLLVLKQLRKFRIDPDELRDDLTGEDTLDDDITPEDGEDGVESEKPQKRASRRKKDSPKKSEHPEIGDDTDPEDGKDEDNIPDFDGLGSQG